MGWPSKDPADYQGPAREEALGDGPPPAGPFLARATRKWPKDPNAPRRGPGSWRRYAHIPLWQIWIAYTIPISAAQYAFLDAIGDTSRLVPSALLQGVSLGSVVVLTVARLRAKAPDS